MKTALLLILPFMVLSCRQPAMPTFADRCKHELLSGDRGNVQLALDGRVQITTPGSTWPMSRNESGFVVGDTSLGYINAIAFTESSFNGTWDWDDEIAYLMRNLTDNPHVRVLSNGMGMFQQKEAFEILLLEDDGENPQIARLSYSYIHAPAQKSYNVSLVTVADSTFEDRICRLLSVAKTIKHNE